MKYRWRRSLLRLVLLPSLVLVTWAVARTAWQQHLFDREIATISHAGYPVDNQSLEKQYFARTSPVATEHWLETMGVFGTAEYKNDVRPISYVGIPSDGGGEPVPAAGETWLTQDADLAFLRRWQHLIANLHAIGEYQDPVQLPRVFDGYDTLLPIDEAKAAPRLLRLHHDACLLRGDHDEAITSAVSIFALANLLRGESSAVGQLVVLLMHKHGIQCIKRSVESHSLASDQRQRLYRICGTFDNFDSIFREAVAFERAAAIIAIQSRSRQIESNWIVTGSWPYAGRFMLSFYNQMHRVPPSSPHEFLEHTRRIAWATDHQFANQSWLGRRDTVLALQTLVALDKFSELILAQWTLTRMARLSLLLRGFESETRRLPGRLEDLESIGVDPVELQSLRSFPGGYRLQNDGGAILWGIDPADWDLSSHTGLAGNQHLPPGIDPGSLWVWQLKPSAVMSEAPLPEIDAE